MLIYYSKKLLITKYKNFFRTGNKNVKNEFNYIKICKNICLVQILCVLLQSKTLKDLIYGKDAFDC